MGLALLAGMLGCSGHAGDESQMDGFSSAAPPAGSTSPTGLASSEPPRSSTTPGAGSVQGPPPAQQAPTPPTAMATPPVESMDDLLKPVTRVENILAANCGACHGPALPVSAGGIPFIDDLDALVDAGLIVPMSSSTSRMVAVMRDGSMPPPGSDYPGVTERDIDVVAEYIDTPLFWSDPP
jgi:mono/diheme cytochrome c family protein